ncbi:SCO family protein [Ponticoccus sp. SC2-23]|uniref:SCO family protein n=1 Tax=Alexandriicola marinus TaxID=2081710 RepID=UPI000FDB1732|nr:SCO family protein [Alexandriicola marinus]MBM1220749.1 SCO family protein [Ponticoccus sp. SC6-9]MBM1226008.1 SCO family protein [Ponticoccus sp. SC6-15]MBM1231305.1 SCO family protein [Ponticoccus sp. SC6-38]MBM1235834.1 SCO family protein [Ponticoccus sp. SC6-45]MBM1240328.1 SCO family protein [Ponticoccus sp. SC6-49]MBM1244863.1 SCO family protein [Ponticoccus sp. SC2-64]MBM1249308.1 SCO family protein [Ponticoccus sp. SC6-42]MBM1252404.1 SCO family protein [Ponticoccus sp. SC6-33]M
MKRNPALASAGVAIVAVGGILIYTTMMGPSGPSGFEDCRQGAVAGDIGGPFELVDETGAIVTDADVITEPTILYFGYTFCPDVCPLDTMRNAQAVDILAERGIEATPVFISIDPERDTPEVVGRFADNFHDKMIGLTGSAEQVSAASQAYRTFYRKVEEEGDEEYYLMDHSTFTYLVLPGYGFVDFVRREDSPENIADRLACFVEAAEN